MSVSGRSHFLLAWIPAWIPRVACIRLDSWPALRLRRMSTAVAINLWVGVNQEDVRQAATYDISHDLQNDHYTITTPPNDKQSLRFAIQDLTQNLEDHGSTVTRVTSNGPLARMAASIGGARRYRKVQIAMPGAKFKVLKVHQDIAKARKLIGACPIEGSDVPGQLAIGMWTSYIDPLLGIPLLHPNRREPGVADVALALSPSLVGTLLMNTFKGYVVMAWSSDLIAAELAALAIFAVTRPTDLSRRAPWEDPVVQRATELDLGVQSPSALVLRPAWIGPNDDDTGLAMLDELRSSLSTLLNIAGP